MTRTWRAVDSLESACARAGGEMSDVMSRCVEQLPDNTELHRELMTAAQAWTDASRKLRRALEAATLAERGPRR